MKSSAERRTEAGRVLVAGVGNVLRCDDGFGPAVIQALERHPCLPARVKLIEVGIGGLGLVLELLERYPTLILVDAVDRGGPPGRLYVLETLVPEGAPPYGPGRHDLGADMHQIGPAQALILARALGVLPPVVRFIGCQPAETEIFSTDLSPTVRAAVPLAVQAILDFLDPVRSDPVGRC